MRPFLVHEPRHGGGVVVVDTPHSGIHLPDHFRFACSREDLMQLHDPHVEKLLVDVPKLGTPVLEACIHRTCIDLNRYEDEINPAMIEGGWPYPVRETFYTRSNLGLFPAMAGPRTNRVAPIYNEKAQLNAYEADFRINHYHRGYYAELRGLIERARGRYGFAVHLNIHSFNRAPEYKDAADIILGDMDGTLCTPHLRDLATEHFAGYGFRVGFNGPYFSGGALVQTTSNPDNGVESLQIEIARDLYMDQDRLDFLPSDAHRVRSALNGLILRIDSKYPGPVQA